MSQSRPNPWRAKLFSIFFVLLVPLIPTAVSFVLLKYLDSIEPWLDGLLFAF